MVYLLLSNVGCTWNAERDVMTRRHTVMHNEIVIDGAIVDTMINPCNINVVEICGAD